MIKPTQDFVLFEPEPLPEKAGSIFLPDSVNAAQQYGHIRAVGPKAKDVYEGDRVFIRKHPVATDVTINWRPHKLMRMEDVLAKVENAA